MTSAPTKEKSLNVKSILIRKLEENKRDLAEYEEIKAALSSQDGKPINKRLKLPPNYELEYKYGMFHLKNTITDNSHLIGYGSNPCVNMAKLSDFDSWACSGAKSRISQIEGILNSDRLEEMSKLFKKLEKTFKEFCSLVTELESGKFESYYNPGYYEILRTIGIPTELISDIKYNKLKAKSNN